MVMGMNGDFGGKEEKDTYGYDANGNQATRTINGATLILSYDAEGLLVSVNSPSINVTFVYDGDGKRVVQTINGVTIYLVGSYYEKQGNTITKYYFAGSQRVAMREGGTLYYLLTDHLGSTSLTTDAGGNVASEMRYSAWGSARYQAGSSPSEYTFTGQYGYDFGLVYFTARWLDVETGHFVQADTLIPGAGQSQAWDRFAYGNNDPVRYIDPSGHKACEGASSDSSCGHIRPARAELLRYGVKLVGAWGQRDLEAALFAVQSVGEAMAAVSGLKSYQAFRIAYNITSDAPLLFEKVHSYTYNDDVYTDGAVTKNSHWIQFATLSQPAGLRTAVIAFVNARNNIVHELGHAFASAWPDSDFDNIPF